MKSSILKVFPQDLFILVIKSNTDVGTAWRDFVDVIKITCYWKWRNYLGLFGGTNNPPSETSKAGNFSNWSQRCTKERERRESKALDAWEVVHPQLLAFKKRENSKRMWIASKSWKWPLAKGHQGNEDLSSTNTRNWIKLIWMILGASSSQILPIKAQLAKTLFSSLRNQEQRGQHNQPRLQIFRNVS